MDCKKIEKVIFRFVYGECDASELVSIKQHLDKCGGYKKESEIIDEILAQFKNSFEDEPLPDGLRDKVLARIHSA